MQVVYCTFEKVPHPSYCSSAVEAIFLPPLSWSILCTTLRWGWGCQCWTVRTPLSSSGCRELLCLCRPPPRPFTPYTRDTQVCEHVWLTPQRVTSTQGTNGLCKSIHARCRFFSISSLFFLTLICFSPASQCSIKVHSTQWKLILY